MSDSTKTEQRLGPKLVPILFIEEGSIVQSWENWEITPRMTCKQCLAEGDEKGMYSLPDFVEIDGTPIPIPTRTIVYGVGLMHTQCALASFLCVIDELSILLETASPEAAT